MALNDTQQQGLKHDATPITADDLKRVLTALGLRKAATDSPGTVHHEMKITDDWRANADASELKSDRGQAYQVDFYVSDYSGKRLGPVFRIPDANVFQLRGAKVMAEMFESVDDLAPFTCPSCKTPSLTWDGKLPGRITKAGMVCGSCDFTGLTGTFLPLRELK